MDKVRWLHISDIHFNFQNYDTKLLREKIIDKIKEKGKNYYKYLFITGDLLFKYENDGDFSEVELFLNKLINISGIQKKNIFMVPGNHDVKRDKNTSYEIDGIIENAEKIKEKVEKMPDYVYIRLMERQNKYIRFYNEFLGREYDKNELHKFINKEDINVIEINSCLLAQSDDSGKLSVNLSKLLDSLESTESNDQKLSIAILHHEPEFLNKNEFNEIIKLLTDKKFDFIFCGHTHKNRYHQYNFGGKPLRKICTAALVSDNDDYSDINFIDGNFEGKNIEIIYYKWCNELSDWRRDVCIDRVADESGIIKLKLEKNINVLKQEGEKNELCNSDKYKECEEKLGDIYTKNTMEKKYVEFIKDSKRVYILVRDLDFLNKETVVEEKSKIIKLGKDCKIIFEKKEKYTSEVKNLIIELKKAGVELKTYPENDEENIRNIKGQFKLNGNGHYECLVIGNQNFNEDEEKFKLFDMNNRFLSKTFWEMVKKFFESEEELEEVRLEECK
ncbi:hypothetical protein GKZ28_19130 [Clostridium chromiireducens]|uniref:Calcineurin-like phosphoesterase domain-containing protein n=1 Tax=Clostridium chromiireducens TaxID=225345 RepID=A0A964W3R1_9CLOT|nr:metallophosphoesterase [Clostridium chromiireducens]MVX65796.1 hypothetical protein [Clostridium chromiireducens]